MLIYSPIYLHMQHVTLYRHFKISNCYTLHCQEFVTTVTNTRAAYNVGHFVISCQGVTALDGDS